jgi:hypothetical protein
MKNRLKVYVTAAVLLFSAGIAGAFDFGLELTNTAGINYVSESSLYTDHKGTVWFEIPFDNSNNNSLSVEASAYASNPVNTDFSDFTYYADVDLFRLSLVPFTSGKSRIALDAGRISVGDITGLVLNQAVDGVEFHGSFFFGNIDFLAAYTGLLNVRKGTSLMTQDDWSDSTDNADEIYATGASRIIGKATVQLPQAFGSTDIILETVGQYDMRRNVESDYIEVVDTIYGTVAASGPIFNNLYYSLSGTYQGGIIESTDVDETNSVNSALASLRMDLFPGPGSQLFAQIVYSPGDSSFFSGFLPITHQSSGTLYTPGYANLLKASLGWYFNPFAALNFDAGGKVFMHTVETDAQPFYECTELSVGATLKITGDLKFRLDTDINMPNEGDTQYQAALKAILDI